MNNKQLPKHGKNSNRNFFAFLALVLVIGAAGIAYVQHLDDANRQKLESKASSKKKIDKFFSSKLVRQKEKQFDFKNQKQLHN